MQLFIFKVVRKISKHLTDKLNISFCILRILFILKFGKGYQTLKFMVIWPF